MKIQKITLTLCLSIVFLTISCENDDYLLDDNTTTIEATTIQESNTGKKKPKGQSNTSLQRGTYTIVNVENPSALYKFTVKGKSILLQSDPSTGTWGTDYYGIWSNSYNLNGNTIQYTQGLATTTYAFNIQSNSDAYVVRTVVTQPYQSNGVVTTTVTNLGTYSK